MKIYHYTTIESLAQILKNKTLLFNRLDCVDDIEEGSIKRKHLANYSLEKCIILLY